MPVRDTDRKRERNRGEEEAGERERESEAKTTRMMLKRVVATRRCMLGEREKGRST